MCVVAFCVPFFDLCVGWATNEVTSIQGMWKQIEYVRVRWEIFIVVNVGAGFDGI